MLREKKEKAFIFTGVKLFSPTTNDFNKKKDFFFFFFATAAHPIL